MYEHLKSNIGKKIVVELVNGKQAAGTLESVNQHDIRLKTDEGVCIILVSAIQVFWENEIEFQQRAIQETDNSYDLLQHCHVGYTRPCPQPFHQPCPQLYMQPCYHPFTQSCMGPYAQPCLGPYTRPCIQAYTQPCPQQFMPTPYEDPCFGRFGYYGHHRCFGRFFGIGFPCLQLFAYPYPPYPYPQYPYPQYPYPQYPYPQYPYPYPYGEASQQTPAAAAESKPDNDEDADKK